MTRSVYYVLKWTTQNTALTYVFCFQPVEATDDAFWDQFWADTATSVQDVFALVPAAEIRALREESPSNLATLCYKVAAFSAKINSSCVQGLQVQCVNFKQSIP